MKSFLLNLRTKWNVMTTPRKASWKKLKNSSDSETHSLKRKSSRQNQPDAVDETKDDTEMCQDSSEVLWMWTRRASQISA